MNKHSNHCIVAYWMESYSKLLHNFENVVMLFKIPAVFIPTNSELEVLDHLMTLTYTCNSQLSERFNITCVNISKNMNHTVC